MAKNTSDLNDWIKQVIGQTLWMWLPFFILFPLIRMTKDKIRKMIGRY